MAIPRYVTADSCIWQPGGHAQLAWLALSPVEACALHVQAAPIPGPLGCQRPSDWDLLWSPARLALKALPVKPGQLISAVPGLMSVTRKVRPFRVSHKRFAVAAELVVATVLGSSILSSL